MKFRILENITADTGFEAFGQSVEQLFENSSIALFSIMGNLKKVEPKTSKAIRLTAETIEDLLFNYLSELIFLKDKEGMLFSKFEILIVKKEAFELSAKISGEKIDPAKHDLMIDAKAITKHNFKIKKNNLFKATVVVDV